MSVELFNYRISINYSTVVLYEPQSGPLVGSPYINFNFLVDSRWFSYSIFVTERIIVRLIVRFAVCYFSRGI